MRRLSDNQRLFLYEWHLKGINAVATRLTIKDLPSEIRALDEKALVKGILCFVEDLARDDKDTGDMKGDRLDLLLNFATALNMSEDVMIPIADESDKQLQRCEEVIEKYPEKSPSRRFVNHFRLTIPQQLAIDQHKEEVARRHREGKNR